MIVGMPQGLLFNTYHAFFKTFFESLGVQFITSGETNKTITRQGIISCTSEACFPIKVYHGHVEALKAQCDLMVIPRIIKVVTGEYVCPHLCSLPEMILHSIDDLPQITYQNIYFNSKKRLMNWALSVGKSITRDKKSIEYALNKAMVPLLNQTHHIHQSQFKYKVLLLGHDYLIHDHYLNQNIIRKLNHMNIGIITADYLNEKEVTSHIDSLPRKPFWHFYRHAYGNTAYFCRERSIDGIIFLSSFGCGVDAIIFEVLQDEMSEFPILMIKVDEHSGDAGLETRLEAFSDMLNFNEIIKGKGSTYGRYSTPLR